MGKVLTKQSSLPHLTASFSFPVESTSAVVLEETFRRASSHSCCLTYDLQPHCTENRHFHVFLSKSGSFVVTDLTYHKGWEIQATVNKKLLMPKKVMKGTNLFLCNVIGFHKGILVIQCFYQRSIHFFICDVNLSTVLCVYERRYQGQENLHLFEFYLSIDRKYIILKKNQLHQSICCSQSNAEDFILLKMSPNLTSFEEMFPEMIFDKFAIMFDHSVPTTSFIVGVMNTCGPRVFRIQLSDVKNFSSDINSVCLRSTKFSVLQHVVDQDLIILSVLGDTSSTHFPLGRKSFNVTNYVYDTDLCFKGQFTYTSPLGINHFAPVFSPSGQFLSCAEQIVNLVTMPRMKSLKDICRSFLQETVLSEDIVRLPIPQSLIRYLYNNV